MSGDFAPPTPPGHQSEGADAGRKGSGRRRPSGRGQVSVWRASRPVAIAAWIAVAAGVLILIGMSWSAALAWGDRAVTEAEVGDTGTMHARQVVPGMCLESIGADGPVAEVTVVRCDEEHLAEVFVTTDPELARHPGEDELRETALAFCSTRLDGVLPAGADWVAWIPTTESWARGDKTTVCVATFDAPVTEPYSPAAKQWEREQGRGQNA